MFKSTHALSRTLRAAVLSASLAGAALLTGCGTFYVDTATKEIPVSAMKAVANPKPTEVSFEFQTKGAPNAAATKQLKEQVVAQINASGLIAKTAATPGSGAAMLNVVLNNVPLNAESHDKALKDGFVAGLTFGLAGASVTDVYICTVTYLPPGQTTPVVKTARHALHTNIGNAAVPQGAGKPVDAATAVNTMTREIVSNALLALSNDPLFNN